MKRTLLGLTLSACTFLALALFMVTNPLNLLMEESESFSFSAFESLEAGTPVSEAIEMLGGPVRVEALGADYWRCPACTAYCFACNPPDWLIGYREAWIYAGPDGLIKEKFINTEP